MPLKRRWKKGIFALLISISLLILFVPFDGKYDFGFIDIPTPTTQEKGDSIDNYYSTPWRSCEFMLHIFANVSIGKISVIFLNQENFINKDRGYNFTSSLELINITGLVEEEFKLNLELGLRGLAILRVEENATYFIDLDLTYLFFMNSYGLFFSGITILLFIAFAFQIKKKSF
jgi:hypothetical protein